MSDECRDEFIRFLAESMLLVMNIELATLVAKCGDDADPTQKQQLIDAAKKLTDMCKTTMAKADLQTLNRMKGK
jgi:hypothetical protein